MADAKENRGEASWRFEKKKEEKTEEKKRARGGFQWRQREEERSFGVARTVLRYHHCSPIDILRRPGRIIRILSWSFPDSFCD